MMYKSILPSTLTAMKNMICSSKKSVSKLAFSLVNTLLLSAPLLSSAAILANSGSAQAQTGDAKFACVNSYSEKQRSKVPTTVVWTPTGKTAIVQWIRPMGNYWTPQRRCTQFSEKINTAYQNGTVSFLTNGKINGQKVICTASEYNGDCKNVLMTLRPQDNAVQLLTELKDALNGRAEGAPVPHSSGEPQLYYKIELNKLIEKGTKAE